MLNAVRGLVLKGIKGQKGFTLVELLVVVGIIVALSAVIVPSVAQFANRGDTGAQSAEMDSVQAALDTLMADNGLLTVADRVSPATSASDFSAIDFGGGALLSTYLRNSTTTYFYCWNASGLVTQQDVASATCPV